MMKTIPDILIFLSLCCFLSCNSQTKVSDPKHNTKDTTRIFIYGTICAYETKEPIEYSWYMIHPTDTGNFRRGFVRQGISDKFGHYKIDITTLVDSTNIIVLRSKYINCALTKIIIKGKIKKSIPIDIELMYGEGEFIREYKINKRSLKLKLVKQIINK